MEEYEGFDDLETSIVNANETLSKWEMTTDENGEPATDSEDDEEMDGRKKNTKEDESMHLSQSDSEAVGRRANGAGNRTGGGIFKSQNDFERL